MAGFQYIHETFRVIESTNRVRVWLGRHTWHGLAFLSLIITTAQTLSREMSLPPGLQHTERCVRYARERIGRSRARVPSDIPLSLQVELEKVVDRFYRAWNNQVKLPYKLEDLLKTLESAPKDKNAVLRSRFSGPFPENGEGFLRLLDKPTAFVDKGNRVIGWFFPNAFTEERSEHVYHSVKTLSNERHSALTASERKRQRNQGSWRDEQSVYSEARPYGLKPGAVNMSICWYSRGFGPHNSKPSPSASLGPVGGGREFVASERDTNALLGVILALAHPRLYDLQMEVLAALHHGKVEVENRERLDILLEHWSSPFTAFALIANRETPFHHDTNGGKMLLDLLATFGRYSKGRLDVPLMGSRFMYNPCTAILLPGYLFEHGACRTDGERICLASFFRPNVGYGTLPHYREIPPPSIDTLVDLHELDVPWESI
ncbi:hypothetical protein NMY22_g5369 [Coprinellus aureogranulatus]|nr:hypothetical protein NMY22_g5369 [Coprinellus aureogranulatus]